MESWELKYKQSKRIALLDKTIIEIEATLLGLQSDGKTNSSELLRKLREFRLEWEREKLKVEENLKGL